ncbi:MAG: hypothetical protein IJP17_01855 [Clostridia bacterium]|nr:hypothetical protein [Clostridia bacterium]
MEHSVFAILGGDARFATLASMLARDGYTVFASGFERCPEPPEGAVNTDVYTAAWMAQSVILPIPPTKDGKLLWAPYAENDILLDEKLSSALKHADIYTGFSDKIRGISQKYRELTLFDYGVHDIFMLRNAQITAEATLMLAIESMPCSLLRSRCLVAGFGRIGKEISRMLSLMGAQVYVAARKTSDFALIEASGAQKVRYSELPDMARDFDLIVNTADALVIRDEIISRLEKDAVIIDVASMPGGTDFESAQRHGIRAIHALGLPGKYAPKSAARVIKDTVLAIMEEEHN